MSPQRIRILFTVATVVWVGGFGFMMFRYPEFFAKINVKFGMKEVATPKHIRFIRWLGMVEMVLAALSGLGTILMPAFGWTSN